MTAPRLRWRTSIRCVRLFLIWIACGVLFLSGLRPQGQVIVSAKQDRPTNKNSAISALHAPPDAYVGSSACAPCHRQIYSTFSRTRMGHSLTPATPATFANLSLPGSTSSETLDRHFDVFQKNGELFQSEYQTGADGKNIFRNTQKIDWIVGANANGLTALIRRGDFLFEAPVSFYAKPQKWELSPGYESKDIGFNRPVLAGCISCHSGRPNPLDQTTGKFAPVAFSQTSIGCENCHGPGAAHIHTMTSPNGARSGPQIVNPSRLNADLENDICMSCHEAGDVASSSPARPFRTFAPASRSTTHFLS
jgi:hypothetical protein